MSLLAITLLIISCVHTDCIGHLLLEQGQCLDRPIPCDIEHCDWCQNGTCMECKEGFYMDFKSKSCLKCKEGCAFCLGPGEGECLSPDLGFFVEKGEPQKCRDYGCGSCSLDELDQKREHFVCNHCEDGYRGEDKLSAFGSRTVVCTPCSVEHCANCDEDTRSCSRCVNGFELKSSKCTPEAPSDKPACRNRDLETGQCMDCENNLSFSYRYHKCVPCPASCSLCFEPNECHSCKKGHTLDYSTNSCKPCRVPGCSNCNDGEDYCEKCVKGHYFDVKKSACLPCDKSCSHCVGPYSKDCTFCKPGLVHQSVVYRGITEEIFNKILSDMREAVPNHSKRPTYMDMALHPFEDMYCVEECFRPKQFGDRYVSMIPAYSLDKCPSLEVKHRYAVDGLDDSHHQDIDL